MENPYCVNLMLQSITNPEQDTLLSTYQIKKKHKRAYPSF